MVWKAYEVILRLRSPLHIGWSKVGNLQRTRPYVTGRVLWGALTMRLTRNQAVQQQTPATDSKKYREIGEQVHRHLAFTYFYPTLKSGDSYQVAWPWQDESAFRRRFLSSYQSTALSYPQQSAAEGMLHEVEFLSPHTLDTGEPVFLKGYIFEKDGCQLDWQPALQQLQLGGERGYGWGAVQMVQVGEIQGTGLFDGEATFNGDGERPIIRVSEKGRLLAHTLADDVSVSGDIEPLIGREWRSDNTHQRYAGQHMEFSGLCFAPGSVVLQANDFAVDKYGVWRETNDRV